MNNLGTNDAVDRYYKDPTNIDSALGNDNLSSDLSNLNSEINILKTTNNRNIIATGVVLTSDDFGKTIKIDTTSAGTDIAITAPDPSAITNKSITFFNSPVSTKNVIVTTPSGNFGNASQSSTITLYPGDTIKLMTLSFTGYQCLSLARASGLGNIVAAHFPTATLATMGSVPQTLVAAPGALSTFCITGGNMKLNYGGTPFTGGSALVLKTGVTTVLTLGAASFVTQSRDVTLVGFTAYITTIAQDTANIVNQPLVLSTSAGSDFSGGNSSLDIVVRYSILTFLQ